MLIIGGDRLTNNTNIWVTMYDIIVTRIKALIDTSQ